MSRISADAMQDNWIALYTTIMNQSLTVDKALLSFGLRENLSKANIEKRKLKVGQRGGMH